MFHADTEADDRQRLEYQQKTDGDHEPAQGVAAHRTEQSSFHANSHNAHKNQADGDRQEERQAPVCVNADNRIGSEHVELAMGEIDDAHDPKNHDQTHRHQGHVTGGVSSVEAGL